MLLRKSQAGEAVGDGWDLPVSLDNAEHFVGNFVTDGGGTQWGLNCSQSYLLTFCPGHPPAGVCGCVRGKPSRKQEESKLGIFSLFHYLILEVSFVDLGRERF